MNVLEKILEEIKERIKKLKEADNMCRVNAERNRNFESVKYFQSLMFATERAESIIGDIIRSHMDEVSGMCGKRLIDANALDEEVRNFFLAITGDPSQAMVVRECKESFRRIIDEQPTVYKANDWILVDERLPEARQHDNGEPIEFIAMIKGAGVPTVLSINEQDKWFRYDEMFYGEGRYNNYDVVAWQPLPNPYKGE